MCMKDELMQSLTDYTWEHNIGLDIGRFKPDFRSRAIPANNLIIINTSWKNRNEVPFSFAHEIGHIMNGDDGIRYYDSETIRDKSEFGANSFAIRYMLSFCEKHDLQFDNSMNFCQQFGIPEVLEYVAALELRKKNLLEY